MALRNKLKSADKPAVRITTNAFYIRALALAAQKFPLMVGTFIPFEAVEKSRVKSKINPAINCEAKPVSSGVERYLACGFTAGSHISIAESINVGFAVHAPAGLVVPVIKDADS